MFSHNQQVVSDIEHFVKASLITCFPMTNRLWVTLHILWKPVSTHVFLWPTESKWYCTFCERHSHYMFSYDQQVVSDIAYFVQGSIITSFPITNSLWVTLHILWNPVSSHLVPWPTVCVCHCTFLKGSLIIHIISYAHQPVSNIAHFVQSHSHLFLSPTASEWWHCTCCEGCLITSLPMTNSLWVTLHILWKRQSHHIFSHDQ